MEIVEVPKKDDESSASELLRPPEGRFEAMDDEDRDDPPRIKYIRRDELPSEKMVNGQDKRTLDEADKPGLENKHIPAIVSPADHVAIMVKLRDAELKLRDAELKLKGAEFKLEKIKKENDILREENTRLKEEKIPSRNPDTSILESLKKKLEHMKEGYQMQVKYMNEATEDEIHVACKKVMRERGKELEMMGTMYIRDMEEVIREEEDADGSSLETMRKEIKKELDELRGDDSGWKKFIPKRDKVIDQEEVGFETEKGGEQVNSSKRRRKSTPKFLCPVGCPNFINFGSASNCIEFRQASKNDRRSKVMFFNLCERCLRSKEMGKHEEDECSSPLCKIC